MSIQHFALRFADSHSAAAYPLPVAGTLTFHRHGDLLTTRIALPDLPSGWIIAASFVTPGSLTPVWQMRLVTKSHTWPLLPVPSTAGERPDRTPDHPDVSVHIDCWHTHRSLEDAQVELTVETCTIPLRYLLCLSARVLAITPEPPGLQKIKAAVPQQISQMTADPAIRQAICSPTSVAMLLSKRLAKGLPKTCRETNPDHQRDALVTEIRDAATGLYGSWPMAVRAAACRGAAAGVELNADWLQALHVLRSGYPFAASIRFETGALRDSPLQQTAGHLVVVHGIDGDHVLVHDPAAPTHEEVPRKYDVVEFSRAWLAMRGASYIIAP